MYRVSYRVINLHNQLYVHQDIYTLYASKSPTCFGTSYVPS